MPDINIRGKLSIHLLMCGRMPAHLQESLQEEVLHLLYGTEPLPLEITCERACKPGRPLGWNIRIHYRTMP